MGKSPGRWIKNVLFGKKQSKSGLSKNARHDKKDAAKTPEENPAKDSLVISNPHIVTDGGGENLELQNSTSGISRGTGTSVPVNQDVKSRNVSVLRPVSDAEMRRQEQAAANVQAVFRGFLARRAFWALKGIIRLQALIRGHLVRRQAVATLRCMQAVVKLQALARRRRIRLSDTLSGIHKKRDIVLQEEVGSELCFMSGKQATNPYIRKLLLSLPTAMPLSLQYELAEPNSAWNWLERWSLSRFWEPPAKPRKVSNVKPQKKQGSSQTVDCDSLKSKRTIRKASIVANGDNGALASLETDKPKRNPRKITNPPAEQVQEAPQNEFERVKRNLRKVSASVTVSSEKSEIETEKAVQQPVVKAIMDSTPPNVSAQDIVTSVQNPADSDEVEKPALVEAPLTALAMDELLDVPHDNHPLVESRSLENGTKMEIAPVIQEEMGNKEDDIGKENQKVRKRRSLPVKQEYAENISQNSPTLPSYMAATESAKAKLRAQGSTRFTEDGAEQVYVRRHSLPASTNGKLSSMSPRIQKPVQANGKGGSKTNRPTPSPRDDKALQPGWRR